MQAGKLKDSEIQGEGRIETPENSTSKDSASKNSRYEKTYIILVSIFLAAILIYTFYIGQLLRG